MAMKDAIDNKHRAKGASENAVRRESRCPAEQYPQSMHVTETHCDRSHGSRRRRGGGVGPCNARQWVLELSEDSIATVWRNGNKGGTCATGALCISRRATNATRNTTARLMPFPPSDSRFKSDAASEPNQHGEMATQMELAPEALYVPQNAQEICTSQP
eukprot:2201452-Pleurochrysis_carterae.AAC.2